MAPTGRYWRVAGAVLALSAGMSAANPLPSPLRRSTAHLPRQVSIGDGAPRGRIEGEYGLAERWCLGQPDGPGDDDAAHPLAEVGPHLLDHLVGQLRPGVIHDEHDGAHVKVGIQALPDEL